VRSYRHLLRLTEDKYAVPATFVTTREDWAVGERFVARNGKRFRILGIDANVGEALAGEFASIWTVQEVRD
jgi:hypothetical protein